MAPFVSLWCETSLLYYALGSLSGNSHLAIDLYLISAVYLRIQTQNNSCFSLWLFSEDLPDTTGPVGVITRFLWRYKLYKINCFPTFENLIASLVGEAAV